MTGLVGRLGLTPLRRASSGVGGLAVSLVLAPTMSIASTTPEWLALRQFTERDGLSQTSVMALAQDATGFVYAGSRHGLARWDGDRWREIELPGQQRGAVVGALHSAASGDLWIGNQAGQVWRLEPDGAVVAVESPAVRGVCAFAPAADGSMWMAAIDGLFRCDLEQCRPSDLLEGRGARTLMVDPLEPARLWVGTDGAGLVEVEDLPTGARRTNFALTKADGLPNSVVLSLARFGGELWIGTGRGLAMWDGQAVQRLAPDGPGAMVFALQPMVDADGSEVLAASLRPGGLALVSSPSSWRVLGVRQGLASNAVHALLVERSRGHLWLGAMNAGVLRLEAHGIATVDERAGLPDRTITGVGVGANGSLWVGTAGGAVEWRQGGFVPLVPSGSSELLVLDVADTPDGSRWIGHSRGLQQWREARLLRNLNIDNAALPAVSVDRLVLRRLGRGFELYASSSHGSSVIDSDGAVRRVVDLPHGVRAEELQALAASPDPGVPGADAVWFGSSAGILRLDHRGWEIVARDCVASRVQALLVDRDALWLGSPAGLHRWEPSAGCAAWPVADPVGPIAALVARGIEIVALGSRGAVAITPSLGPQGAPRARWGPDAGWPNPEVTGAVTDVSGRLLAATAAGLAVFDPAPSWRPAAGPAPLVFERAVYGAARHMLRDGAQLPWRDSTVELEFRLLSFEREHAIRYRTELSGPSTITRGWTSAPRAEFARLPPGHYRVLVDALDAAGTASDPLTLSFVVSPPWWQWWWARALMGLAALGGALLWARSRAAAAERRAEALEHEVAARTRELAEANTRLEQAAITDPLTGLKNRRYFGLVAKAEAERALRHRERTRLLVVVLDLDHFKSINDRFGHDVGDAALVAVARTLERMARASDAVLRWGGEEFLLLLGEVQLDAVPGLLRRLLTEIAETSVETSSGSLRLAASLGACCFPLGDGDAEQLSAVITSADRALYQAKARGRNRAVWVVSADGNSKEVVAGE